MRIVVTGASGFIGRPLVEKLGPGHELWAVGRSPVPSVSSERSAPWDLTEAIPRHALPGRIDAVIHLAQSRDYREFPSKALAIARVNVEATLELLDYARDAGAKCFVFASSGGVYGGASHPIGEDARVVAPDFYLATKLAGEALAAGYRSLMAVQTLRLFFVYGRGQSPDRFFTNLVRRVLNGQPIVLYGRDGMRLNPIHVADVVDAIAASLTLQGSNVVNIAGPEVLTLRRIADLVGAHVGKTPVFDQRPADPERDLVADVALMERLVGAPHGRFDDRIGQVCEEVMAARR